MMAKTRSLGWKLGSHRVSVFEALADNDRQGLTIPEISRIGRVPRSTAHRIVEWFAKEEVVAPAGRRGKAPIYRINAGDPDLVEAVRALRFYAARIALLDHLRRSALQKGTASKSDVLGGVSTIRRVSLSSARYEIIPSHGQSDEADFLIEPVEA